VEIGTDPTKYDSSGDGIPDGYAYHTEYLDPTRLNVTVEVYTDTGVSIPHSVTKIQESFDTAPVESDLGKQGINLTILNKGTINSNRDRLSYSTYIDSIYTQNYVNNDKGVYHVYITDDISGSNVIGMTSTGTDGILVQRTSSKQTAATIQHELGHQLGLVDNFAGIDSRQYNWEQYPSVMNYSVCQSCSTDEYLQYSSGEGYNDWGYIESNIDQHMANTDVIDECVEQHSTQQKTFDC
jgi:hypothetical protein